MSSDVKEFPTCSLYEYILEQSAEHIDMIALQYFTRKISYRHFFEKKHHVPMVLWGCSIEPEAMCGRVLEDLKLYNYIIARESITYQALKNLGFTNLSLFPDPAFQLNRIDFFIAFSSHLF